MRFLIDESADARIAAHLRSLGHDATTVAADHRPGLPDDEVLRIAQSEGRILITIPTVVPVQSGLVSRRAMELPRRMSLI